MQLIVLKSFLRGASLRSPALTTSRHWSKGLRHNQPEVCFVTLGKYGEAGWQHVERDSHRTVTLNTGPEADGAVTEVMQASVPLGYCRLRLRTTGWTRLVVLR